MVADTSAVVAILGEPDADRYLAAIRQAPRIAMSALTVYETRIVLSGRIRGAQSAPAGALDEFEGWLAIERVEIAPFDADQAVLAHQTYLRFGKGFHPAALNLVDCAAYALATSRGEPLLFKGNDFARTDVVSALA